MKGFRKWVLSVLKAVLGKNYEPFKSFVFIRMSPLQSIRIRKSQFFDKEYYEALSGKKFGTFGSALTHWRSHGMAELVPPNPAIEPEYLPTPIRQNYRRGNLRVFLDYLESRAGRHRAWSASFDPRSITDFLGTSYFAELTTDTPLPVGRGWLGPVPTWGSFRDESLRVARQLIEEHLQRRESHLPHWNYRGERKFVSKFGHVSTVLSHVPKVSVIMPTWNREAVVGEAIRSVQLQDFQDWELIVIDDGSTDNSARVVQDLAEHDPRIKLVSGGHKGVCAARNLGISKARGTFIAFLDTDNQWTNAFLRIMVSAMEQENLDVAYSAVRVHEPDGKISYLGGSVSHQQLLFSNYVDLNSLVSTADALTQVGGFDESLRRWVDHDLLLKLARKYELNYLPFIGCEYSTDSSLDRITTMESSNWQFAVLGKHMVDWGKIASELETRVQNRVSIVMLTFQDHVRTISAVNSALKESDYEDIEIILVDNGSRDAVFRTISSAFASNPLVTLIRLPRNYNFATGCNVGFGKSTGSLVMFLNNDVQTREGWLSGLVQVMVNENVRAAQPLLLYPDGTVQTAGTVFPVRNGLPSHFLARHPIGDAIRHGGKGFSAVTAGAMLVRAEEFTALHGFDAIFANGSEDIDYCLRAIESRGGEFCVVPQCQIVHEESVSPGRHAREEENRRLFLERWNQKLPAPQLNQWKKIGLDVFHTSPDTNVTVGISRARAVRRPRSIEGTNIPSLRWAIRIGAEATKGGDLWGDVPFAQDLAESLEKLGQEVNIDRRGAFNRPTTYLDDVVLLIRGFQAAAPVAGRCNLIWVISRPDLITPNELNGYHDVFAASQIWADHMSELSGISIKPLLQATNPKRFNPQRGNYNSGEKALFVGGPRPPIGRKIVADMVSADQDFGVWGPGWEEYVDSRHFRGARLAPNESGKEYASAQIVLNDHFQDMAAWGFISNRLFDAVASGARVLSDEVVGISEVFEGAVRTYQTPEDLKEILDSPDSFFPSRTRMLEISRKISEYHSFEKRAERLLCSALEYHGVSITDEEIMNIRRVTS